MPRLGKTASEQQYDSVRSHIAAYADERKRAGWDCRQTAKALGLSYETLNLRKKNPEGFTLSEIQRIANVLNIKISTLLGEKE